MAGEYSDYVLATFYVGAPKATRLHYSQHLLVAYKVVPLSI